MKIITTFIGLILAITIIGAIAISVFVAVEAVTGADAFSSMNSFEKGYTWITNRDKYTEMEKSYNLVTSIENFLNN